MYIPWNAILTRGHGAARIKWVKGHATEDAVHKGVTTRRDKDGNDKADTYAHKGVANIEFKCL